MAVMEDHFLLFSVTYIHIRLLHL